MEEEWKRKEGRDGGCSDRGRSENGRDVGMEDVKAAEGVRNRVMRIGVLEGEGRKGWKGRKQISTI